MTDYIIQGTTTNASKESFRNLIKERYNSYVHVFEPDTLTLAFGEDGSLVIKTREEGNALLLTPYSHEIFKNIPNNTVRLEQESRLIGKVKALGFDLRAVGE
jgi:hypothetical protein